MDLKTYLMLIIKETYHQNISKLSIPSYIFDYKSSIRINEVPLGLAVDKNDGGIQVEKDLSLNNILYSPSIYKLEGKSIGRATAAWSISTGNAITIKDLVDLTTRFKPVGFIFKKNRVCPVRNIDVHIYKDTMRITYMLT